MRMFDIIAKKRDRLALTREELQFAIDGYVNGEVADYQMSALLMAIYLNGMSDEETAVLTDIMAHSGDMADLSAIEGIKVDKHSTGGVGDKTTLIIAPIAAACGVKVAKMSGRGLGHTGGTVDKIESVPGAQTAIHREAFFKQVNEIGLAVIGQSGNLTPADKKLYALRDVTATISCIPLIASSIMSKKLAAGSDCILLDVKSGSGAFMKTVEDSAKLAQAMVQIGTRNGREVAAVITDMDIPLGRAVGNNIEVAECIQVLKGQGPADLTELCIVLATEMLMLAQKGTSEQCRQMVMQAIQSGKALQKLRQMFAAQGGDVSFIDHPENFSKAALQVPVLCPQDGYITAMNTEKIGDCSVVLGAGRTRKEDTIDYSAGILIEKKTGDKVKKGDVLAVLLTNNASAAESAAQVYQQALQFGSEAPVTRPVVLARADKTGVTIY